MSSSSFPLDTLNLSAPQLAACNRAGLLHASEILLPSAADLNKKLKFSRQENVIELIKSVSRAIVPEPLSFGELDGELPDDDEEDETRTDLADPALNWVSTGDLGIDAALGGGLRVGTITELTGESAAGKSHFCLSLAIAAQVPALTKRPGGAMFLTSEREIATDRLYELADHFLATHVPRGRLDADSLLDNVLSTIVTDIALLEHTLMYKVPYILRKRAGTGPSRLLGKTGEDTGGEGKPIRVLIIDSITALIRGADSTYANSSSIGLAERSRYLCAVSDRLKALAVEFNLAVVVINQVSDVFTRLPMPSTPTGQPATQQLSQFYTDGPEPPMLYATQSRWFSGQTETLKKEASLGIVWANAINTRIMLSRTGRRRMVDPRDLSKRPKRRRGEVEEDDTVSSAIAPLPVVDESTPMLIRRAHVVFCPFAPVATIDYIISPTGVHSIPDSYRLIDIAQTVRRRARMARAILGDDDDTEDMQVGLAAPNSDPPSQSQSQMSERVGESRGKGDDDVFDEFGDEVFDDFGDLPAEFWEGKMEAVEPLLVGGKL